MTGSCTFRPYQAGDRAACFRIFDDNCPEFFAPNERADLVAFLATPPAGYEVALLGDDVVAAFGVLREDGAPTLRWIMIGREAQGHGLGRLIMARAVATVRAAGETQLRIATSHKSDGFFTKLGATEVRRTPDGWGPGLHRVDMVLSL